MRLFVFIHLFYDENSYRKLDVVYKQPLVAAPTARTKLAWCFRAKSIFSWLVWSFYFNSHSRVSPSKR